MVKVAVASPEPENNFHFLMVDGKFILLGDIDKFLEKNYENFKTNG